MAKKLKEDVNLDEIDENFIISSIKTTEPQQTGGTLQAEERAGKGKQRGLSEYGEKFLKRNELKTRQCVYISGQIHAVISRLVHVIADKDITVGGYIDTVLAEHLERHKEEINELYRQKREDLI